MFFNLPIDEKNPSSSKFIIVFLLFMYYVKTSVFSTLKQGI